MGTMAFPDEIEARPSTPKPNRRRWVRRVVVGLVSVIVGSQLLLWSLFVIKPLRHVESLTNPRRVSEVAADALILADGTRKPLPYVKRLPVGDPIFLAAIKDGVEIDGKGDVFGLVTVYPSCGMTFWGDSTIRCNLSELTGALDPGCLDDARVPGEVVEYLREGLYRPPNPRRLNDYFLAKVRSVRGCLEHLEMMRKLPK